MALAVDYGGVRTAADAMITEMKVHRADATVADLREVFTNERVHVALLVCDDSLVAVVTRDDLTSASGGAPAASLGRLGHRVVGRDADLDAAFRTLLRTGGRRLAVVDTDGRLVGLLCLKRSRTGFCTHDDLAARRADLRASSRTRE